jgi:hypothetical protein
MRLWKVEALVRNARDGRSRWEAWYVIAATKEQAIRETDVEDREHVVPHTISAHEAEAYVLKHEPGDWF